MTVVRGERVELFNPLPATLTHYELALHEALQGLGSVQVQRVGVERHEGPFLRRLVNQLLARGRAMFEGGVLIVLWPSFGLWDPLSWWLASRRRRVIVVVHDPEPMRRQHGYGRLSKIAIPLVHRAGITVVAHSRPAEKALLKQGWTPLLLPHPLHRPRERALPRGKHVVVLGQHKPSRSLSVLAELATVREFDGHREIWGRGWPRVPGWEVHEEFLAESRFEEVLGSARCLVLPYERFFQSGVALRAIELGIPVVGARHPFLEDVLGADWPGLVDRNAWGDAVKAASAVPGKRLYSLALSAQQRAEDAWRAAVFGTDAGRIPG